MATGGTPIPDEGRLINTAAVLDPSGNDTSQMYLIGWYGAPMGIGKAPLIAVQVSRLQAAMRSSVNRLAVDDVEAAAVEDMSVPAAEAEEAPVQEAAKRAADIQNDSEKVRVSLDELLDAHHGLKQADLAYTLEADGKTAKATLVADSQHVLQGDDATPKELAAQLKTHGHKKYITFDTGLEAATVSLDTLTVNVEAQYPSPVSYYVKKGNVWVTGIDPTATYHVHVMVPTVPANLRVRVTTK